MMDGDYPRWTEYSLGNPDCWRRIYNGRLLYVIASAESGRRGPPYTWHDANAKPFAVWGPFDTREGAMKDAEAWADQNPDAA